MNLNIFKKRKSGLTLVVATTLLFAAPHGCSGRYHGHQRRSQQH